MNPQPGCLPISLGLALIAFLLSSTSSCSTDTNDSNSTAAESYRLDDCLVSGNDLDEEGSDMIPFTYIHEGTTIKFCCEPCLPKFKKNPAKYMAIFNEEMESLKKKPSS